MEIFYYLYQDKTVQPIFTLQNLCLTYLLFYLTLLGIIVRYIIIKTNTNKFSNTTQIWILKWSKSVFFSGMKSVK